MLDYFEKLESPAVDLSWNIPETKQGSINVIGGNSQNFKISIKISEFLATHFPIQTINTVFPDALQSNLPPLPNFVFLPSTDSGSLGDTNSIATLLNSADFNLLLGDLSKNSITARAVASACKIAERPLLITRDAIDLLASQSPEKILLNDHIIFFASMPQLQALFRAVYYPKMILLSQSLLQIAEILHKFTLSYPTKIVTLHSDQILLAENGNVKSISLAKASYSPFAFWNGESAASVAAFNLYNPNNFLGATASALIK